MREPSVPMFLNFIANHGVAKLRSLLRLLDEGEDDKEIARVLRLDPSQLSRFKKRNIRKKHYLPSILVDVLLTLGESINGDIGELRKLAADSEADSPEVQQDKLGDLPVRHQETGEIPEQPQDRRVVWPHPLGSPSVEKKHEKRRRATPPGGSGKAGGEESGDPDSPQG